MKSLVSDSTDTNFFLFEEQPVLQNAGSSSSASITTASTFGKQLESMPAIEPRVNMWMNSNILNQNGILDFDSDEDFGEFESVPAGGFSNCSIENDNNNPVSSFSSSFGFGVTAGGFSSNINGNHNNSTYVGNLERVPAHGFSLHGEDNHENGTNVSSYSSFNFGVAAEGFSNLITEGNDTGTHIGDFESALGGFSHSIVEKHDISTHTSAFTSFSFGATAGEFDSGVLEDHDDGTHITSCSSPFDFGTHGIASHVSGRMDSLPSNMMEHVFTDQLPCTGPTSFLHEEIDDDEWGDFVENSASAIQASPWLDSQENNSMTNLSDGLLGKTIEEVLPKENIPDLSLVAPVASQTGEFWNNGLLHVVDKIDINDLITQQFDQLNVPSHSTQSITPFQKPGLKPEKLGAENQHSHSRKSSMIETISAPLSLSLFGEEIGKDEFSKEDELHLMDARNDGTDLFSMVAFEEEAEKKEKQSLLGSGANNFSEIILSLYTQPDDRASQVGSNIERNFNATNIETSISFDNKHQSTCDGYPTCTEKDMIERQSQDADHCLSYNIQSAQPPDSILGINICSCFCELCNALDFSEFDLGLKKDIFRDVKPQEIEVHISDLLDSLSSLGSSNWDKLSASLIEDGRIEESLAFRVHIPILFNLSSMHDVDGKVDSVEEEKKLDHQHHKRGSFDFTLDASVVGRMFGQEKLETISLFFSNFTLKQMANKLGKDSSDVRAMTFQAEFHQEKLISLARTDVQAAVELYAKAIATFWLLACATTQEQSLFLKSWATIASACAFELKHALNLWTQAQHDGIHHDLLAHPQGRNYFAAVGQIYTASLILAATSIIYKPWLDVRPEEGENLRSSLECCKVAWIGTQLGDGVRLALHGMGSSLPSAVSSWEEIEGLAGNLQTTTVFNVKTGALNGFHGNTCGISLLPVRLFNGVSSAEWGGRCCFLPLANLWANRISSEPPNLPTISLGTVASF